MKCSRLMFPAPQYPLFPAICSQRRTRLNAGRKAQSLQDDCRLIAWKFFHTQQQGHEQPEEPMSSCA
ncbi:hypothetical protein TNCV_181721 [Trichonephila clavipes]|nr:hypothetical protein TNCV_181721 [Trichonephila clavipes]